MELKPLIGEKDYYGVAGWLALAMIGQAGAFLFLLYTEYYFIVNEDLGDIIKYFSDTIFAWVVLLVIAGYISLSVFVGIAFLKRQKKTRRLMIILLTTRLPLFIVLLIYDDYSMTSMENLAASWVAQAFVDLFWIFYFKNSHRVKVTFST